MSSELCVRGERTKGRAGIFFLQLIRYEDHRSKSNLLRQFFIFTRESMTKKGLYFKKLFGLNLLLALDVQNIEIGEINAHYAFKYPTLLHRYIEHTVDDPVITY